MAFGLLFPLVFASAAAQTPAPRDALSQRDTNLDSHKRELHGMQESLEASKEERRKLEAEIASLRTDRAKFLSALLETTEAAKATEREIAEAEARLETSLGTEAGIKQSLAERRGVIAEILAALQRMGRKPPPAVLVAPEDMLQAIRTSMLLGAVLPEMQSEIDALAADLADLVQSRKAIADERAELTARAASLAAERARIAALVEERQSALTGAEQALGSERRRIADLAKQAADLEDLVAKMESEVTAAARGAEAARKADEASGARDQASGVRQKVALGPFSDPTRLAPATSFPETKGLLPLPVSGMLVKNFGQPDGFGGVEKGMLIATRTGAFVASPCDGWVSYAGPYRSYGQLLIVNAGRGYHIILAGMDRIHVNVGQFILAGEPVASMGDGSTRTAAAIAVGATQPILYVEFRKDGAAIDPGPWWAKPELQKVGG